LIAGFHFNSALARIAATRARANWIANGYGLTPDRVKVATARPPIPTPNAHAIKDEVNDFKHQPEGLFRRREATYAMAVAAISELVAVAESWDV
jgi:hypothetical protein